jgi:L-serine dehydratase
MLNFDSILELVEQSTAAGKRISELVLEAQAEELGRTAEDLYTSMAENLRVMREAVNSGISPVTRSASGLSGGDAFRMKEGVEQGKTLGGKTLGSMLVKALTVSELNACMGRIVAAPTAGSCGILPAVLLTAMEERNLLEEKVVMSLFTAAGFGMVIARQASISGAEGGCQAECGSAGAMAAAALVELMDGTPRMAANACTFALKNVLGLVCDPVAGLVEVPCIKRNVSGAANALISADMALAGIESVIPADEVIMAMRSVGNIMVPALKETAEGGLAATPTGKRLAREIFGEPG